MSEYSTVKVSIEDRIAVLTMDHPPVNALNNAMLADLDAALDEMIANEQVRVIVITGAGQRAFVAGADIKMMADFAAAGDAAAARAMIRRGQELCNKIEACPKPVIAAVNGVALGGGLELMIACHMRVFSDRARVGVTELNVGLVPGWGATWRLPRIVGLARALEMILTGDVIDAGEAFRLGLANKVVPADQVLAESLALARRIAGKSRLTSQAALRTVVAGMHLPQAEALAREAEQFVGLVGSHDMLEGLTAFLEKRQPAFTDD